MQTETEMFRRELARIAALDRAYYFKPTPTSTERAKYHKRQEKLEQIRSRFYAKLDRLKPGIASP